ncbi:MAG: bifunctional hydroxymethylpyrimidine kinase/phosphomethylpyrimidine kinase [Ruminococcaceae bacterium]|nr:bifunctional hydroxymethylpyrimidine kinase/phosphomethylpyrimidine kinase [Oscillospiraceae bacterium]
MLKGAIFDLDGTLLDSMFIWDTFGEDYLRKLGKEPKENLAETFKIFTLEQAAVYYREHYDVTHSISEIVDDINNMVAEIYRTKVTLKSDVKDFLKRLHASGVKMCVATVTDRPIVEDVLKRLGVLEYFSAIFTCSEVGYDKTTPHIYRKALEYLGTEKNETVVFEDAFHALQTAISDGFKVAAVYDKHELRQKEIKEISDYYITDFGSFCFKTKMKTALTIAGSDSSGGAGIQADIKTMTMNGVYAMSAITALTAQNTTGVRAILESTPEFLKQQIDAVFEDIYPDSVKIGMVSSSELVKVIADRLKFYNAKNIVVDPVMVATSGSTLMKNDAVKILCEELLPIATLITPNIPEAEVLSDLSIKSKDDMLTAAKFLSDTYGCAVLLKGGHSINDANDLLYTNGEYQWFEGKRIDNPNTHGTGCTLSSAIASNLAKGHSLAESVKKAKEYISDALLDGLDLGKASGPLNHAFAISSGI